MPTLTVYPVSVDFGFSSSLSFVGDVSGLSDGSDSTYLKLTDLNDVNGTGASVTFGSLADVPTTVPVEVYMTARYQLFSGDQEAALSIVLPFEGGGQLALISPRYPEGAAVTDISPTFGLDPGFVDELWLLAMSWEGLSGGVGEFRLFELSLTVMWEGDPLPAAVQVLRRYPRDDVHGFSGVARNYPPPRRARNYGQQP